MTFYRRIQLKRLLKTKSFNNKKKILICNKNKNKKFREFIMDTAVMVVRTNNFKEFATIVIHATTLISATLAITQNNILTR